MANAHMQRLVLWAPAAEVTVDTVAAAIAAGDVAAAVLPGTNAGHEAVALCQREGVAAFVTDEPVAGADGLHAAGEFAARRTAVKASKAGAVGAEAATKHEAMELGEAGAAYIWFGAPDVADEASRALATWWTALFEVPAVVAGAATLGDIDALVGSGAEFVALGPALLTGPDGAREAVLYAGAAIAARVAA